MMLRQDGKIRVLVMHQLGANSVAMRRRIDPVLAAMPEDVRQRFELIHLDAPLMMPALEQVSINDKDGVGIGFKEPSSKGKANEQKTPEQIEAEKREKKLNLAIQAISYARVVKAEVLAEENRYPKRNRKDLATSVKVCETWLDAVKDDKAIMEEAQRILDSPAPSSKQPRWWFIRSKGGSGEWIGQEYMFAYWSDLLRKTGPIDGVITCSSGSILAYYCQAMLCGGIPSSQEPLWNPPPHQPPFKFILSYCPFFPPGDRFPRYLEVAGQLAPGRAVLVHGTNDKISTVEARDEFARLVKAEDIWLHSGGHVIPKDQSIVEKAALWLEDVAATEFGPGSKPWTHPDHRITARL